MKLLTKDQSVRRQNSSSCIVEEYNILDPDIDFAVITLSGRYPDKGYAVNQISKELVFVQEGQGVLYVDETEHVIKKGDLILIEAGEKFFWEGEVILHISCHPAFSIGQHLLIL